MPTKLTCLGCNLTLGSQEEMRRHAVLFHGYKEGALVTRRPKMFLDGAGYHCVTYEWDLGTVKIEEKQESGSKVDGQSKPCYICGKPNGFLCDWPDLRHKSGT